ncbi:glycosyltransferase [Paenibacillus sp. 481]|uniref:glycosyltransferase n=1 Tax=Paenibacillus sp. 481 TaxID=2835869 RepID=UPI001E642D6B|nr:glycosyltransferase [Paenibacillus sp. 481]UHA74513.1 glycosyltransferase [Paenibacillus sp. 481]
MKRRTTIRQRASVKRIRQRTKGKRLTGRKRNTASRTRAVGINTNSDARTSLRPLPDSKLLRSASEAGRIDGQTIASMSEKADKTSDLAAKMQEHFRRYIQPHISRLKSYDELLAMAEAYRNAYVGAHLPELASVVLIPSEKKMAVVLCAYNEQDSLESVLNELKRLPLHEVVVVVNGSVDDTFDVARRMPNATIIHYKHPIGHDVGRAVGAKVTTADIILFTDGDFPIQAEQLGAFLWAVERGVDVALNDISPLLDSVDKYDGLSYCKQWLNHCFGRGDLHANSMTAIPHALSRKALTTVGASTLAVPPKAQMLAMMKGLNVQTAHVVDVITRNRIRETNIGADNVVAQLIIGDHLEAFHTALFEGGLPTPQPMLNRESIAKRRNGE